MPLESPICITVQPSSFLWRRWLQRAGHAALLQLPWDGIDRAVRHATADALDAGAWGRVPIAYGRSLARLLWTGNALTLAGCSVGVMDGDVSTLHGIALSTPKGHRFSPLAAHPIPTRRPHGWVARAVGVHQALTVQMHFHAETSHARLALMGALRAETCRDVAPRFVHEKPL